MLDDLSGGTPTEQNRLFVDIIPAVKGDSSWSNLGGYKQAIDINHVVFILLNFANRPVIVRKRG